MDKTNKKGIHYDERLDRYYDSNGKWIRDTADTPTLYTIKPLEWMEDKSGYGCIAITSLGTYRVALFNGEWRWCYASMRDCTSIEDGKAQAEKHYREQLGNAWRCIMGKIFRYILCDCCNDFFRALDFMGRERTACPRCHRADNFGAQLYTLYAITKGNYNLIA